MAKRASKQQEIDPRVSAMSAAIAEHLIPQMEGVPGKKVRQKRVSKAAKLIDEVTTELDAALSGKKPRKKRESKPKVPKEPKPKKEPKQAKAPKEPKIKTLVFERTEFILRKNAAGAQVGHTEQYRKLEKEFGTIVADTWLAEHIAQTKWARNLLKRTDVILGDTETTGRAEDAVIVDIGICKLDRTVIIDSLVHTDLKIGTNAEMVHGISNADIENAPKWRDLWPTIAAAFKSANCFVAYNEKFDRRLIEQTNYNEDLPDPEIPPGIGDELMIRFANWVGDWDAKWQHYKWHKLESGHRALGDALAMIDVLEKMASSEAC